MKDLIRSPEYLKQVLEFFPHLKIGVVGDIGLDGYWYIDMTRSHLSRETPLFPRPVVRETYSPGAGSNVAQNLKALGVGLVEVFTVIGEDNWAKVLLAELEKRDIRTEQILQSPERRTTTYIKLILIGYNSQQEDARIDFENTNPVPGEVADQLINRLEDSLPVLDALIITDQLEINGVITPAIQTRLVELAAQFKEKPILVDSRQRIGVYDHMVLKPNWIEAVLALHPDRDPRHASWEDLIETGKVMSQKSGRPVFVTLSERGVLVCDQDDYEHIPAAPVRPPLDPVGAGDTFIAALAACLAMGVSPLQAGWIANLAAAVTVEKLHETGTASPQEIMARYQMTLVPEGGA